MAEQYWQRIQDTVKIVEIDADRVRVPPSDRIEGLPDTIFVLKQKKGGTEVEELNKELGREHGSGVHGETRDHELPGPGEKGFDPQESPVAIGAAEREQIAEAVARNIIESEEAAQGSVPAGLVRWAKAKLTPPQVPWEKELGSQLRNAITMARGCVDYSYRRPNSRYTGSIIMPGMERPMPSASVVIDTSASMQEEDLRAALSETEGILRACGQLRVPVYCCDAAAAPRQYVGRALDIKLVGGGGTNMGAGIEAALEDGNRVVIVLTDMGTGWPDSIPKGIQLVVGAVGAEEGLDRLKLMAPPYARRVVGIRTGASRSQ
jgi:predicted metal-dependent peptidase